MPASHRLALKKLLDHVKHRIEQDEAKLVGTTDDEERAKLIEEIADLHVRKHELTEALIGDVE